MTVPAKPAAKPDLDPNDPKFAGHYEGKVVGPNGKPFPGAMVFAMPDNSSDALPGSPYATSDANGKFSFDAPAMTFTGSDGLPARRQGRLIAISKDKGYAPDSVVTWGVTGGSFRSHWDPVQGAELTLKLVRDDVPVKGRILDPSGKPIAGAKIKVNLLQTPSHQTFDEYLEKYKISKNQLWMFDFRSIYLTPEAAKPILTDADGRFELKNVGLGRDRVVTIDIKAPGMVEASLPVMTRKIPDIVLNKDADDGYPSYANFGADFEIKLKKARTFSGVVRDRETHEPISGIWVGVNVLHALKYGNQTPPVLTDKQGRFTISGVHPALTGVNIEAVSPPGMNYMMAQTFVGKIPEFPKPPPTEATVLSKELVEPKPPEPLRDTNDVVIECSKAIPFRIKLVDEAGKPVDSGVEVEYQPILPNPHLDPWLRGASYYGGFALSMGANRGEGVYEGFVIPGPGAILVQWTRSHSYRPAFVDPKAFFEPGRTEWTAQEKITAYGTENTLIEAYGWVDQHDYAAIALVKPEPGSKPLELSATLFDDKPRTVTLLGPDGEPVVGVETQGLTYHPWDAEPTLRASTFPLTKLHPDRVRRIKFLRPDKGWIGFLLAKGDAQTPYTVTLHPWAGIKGRVVDENGKPVVGQDPQGKMGATLNIRFQLNKVGISNEAVLDEYHELKTDTQGQFEADHLLPDMDYNGTVYRPSGKGSGDFKVPPLQPQEIRDIGEIRIQPEK